MILFQPHHRPALMQGVAERLHPIMSVHTHLRPPCSWELFLVAPCLAWPQRMPPHNICVSPLMRFLMTYPCHPGGRWPRLLPDRDTSSSKYTGKGYRRSFCCPWNLNRLQIIRICFGKRIEEFECEQLVICFVRFNRGLTKIFIMQYVLQAC